MNKVWDVIIVGAGLSGLTAALTLNSAGVSCLVLDASDAVGGRVKTDSVKGFLLNRGFQVLLTAYPEVQRFLDLEALKVKPFYNGVAIRIGKKFHTVSDPWRHPLEGVKTLMSSVGNLQDKLKIAQLRLEYASKDRSKFYWKAPECSTLDFLRRKGFSQQFIQQFFQPFFSGVFLEPDLQTSSRLFEFLYACFSSGSIVLPAQGMQAIPDQLAEKLTASEVRLNTEVTAVEATRVQLADHSWIDAKAVVLATDVLSATSLLGNSPKQRTLDVSCYYFAAAEPPPFGNRLMLNAEPAKRVNTVCIPSAVCQQYAGPDGETLISVSSLSNEQSPEALHGIRAELCEWFGRAVNDWEFLKCYNISRALPAKTMPFFSVTQESPVSPSGVFLAGDYLNTPSINGAMMSGRLSAEAVLETFKLSPL